MAKTIQQTDEEKNKLFADIKAGTHEQFIFNSKEEQIKCKCGCKAIWWRTGYLCGSITAYPCKYNPNWRKSKTKSKSR